MWRRYGAELDFPHPLDCVPQRPTIPPADPDACEYLVKLDGVQQRCNEPAEWVNRQNFRYCGPHAEQVQKDIRRRGGAMVLAPFKT